MISTVYEVKPHEYIGVKTNKPETSWLNERFSRSLAGIDSCPSVVVADLESSMQQLLTKCTDDVQASGVLSSEEKRSLMGIVL